MMNDIYFINKFREWGREIWKHKYLILMSIVMLIIAIIINYFAGIYVMNKAKVQQVPDLILDHFGPYNLSYIFVWGFIVIIGVALIYCLFFNIKRLHTAIAQFSLLTIIRALFIILTHLKTPTDAIAGKFPWILHNLRFENDMFFSGHVAVPFLGFLVFKESKIRYFFLISSIVMAITVLGMHQHYSIDVFAAFFITYGSYKIAGKLFEKIEGFLKEKY